MVPLLTLAVIIFLALLAAVLYFRKQRASAECSSCGSPSQFGYSTQAESEPSQIARLCLTCLTTRLRDDYKKYEGRALVIEPAAGLPCYVFQPKSKWADFKLAKDLTTLVSGMESTCRDCSSVAHFLWITSNGLIPSSFSRVLSDGLSQTLLCWGNDQPYAVCSQCCVALIVKTIQARSLTFLEVCAPRSEDGFVIPMGY
jgi:hypothetical protein